MATPAPRETRETLCRISQLSRKLPAIQTNLTIYTTKHIYHLLLRSRGSHAMQEVEFYYPDELMTAMKMPTPPRKHNRMRRPIRRAMTPRNVVKVANVDPRTTQLRVHGGRRNVPWKPIQRLR